MRQTKKREEIDKKKTAKRSVTGGGERGPASDSVQDPQRKASTRCCEEKKTMGEGGKSWGVNKKAR